MSDREGDKSKQPPECEPRFTPSEANPRMGKWSQCPNLKGTAERMDSESYGCDVCGKSYMHAALVSLVADRKRLLEILRPFAEAANEVDPTETDDCWLREALLASRSIAVGDLRAARAFLTAQENKIV